MLYRFGTTNESLEEAHARTQTWGIPLHGATTVTEHGSYLVPQLRQLTVLVSNSDKAEAEEAEEAEEEVEEEEEEEEEEEDDEPAHDDE